MVGSEMNVRKKMKSHAGACLSCLSADMIGFCSLRCWWDLGLGWSVPRKYPWLQPPLFQARRNGRKTRRSLALRSLLWQLTRATCAVSTTRPWWQGSAYWAALTPCQVMRWEGFFSL